MRTQEAFQIMGLFPPFSKEQLQAQYAKKASSCNPETNPTAWMNLHQAYKLLLGQVGASAQKPIYAPVSRVVAPDEPAEAPEEWALFESLENEIQEQERMHPGAVALEDSSVLAEIDSMIRSACALAQENRLTARQILEIHQSPEFQKLKSKTAAAEIFARLYEVIPPVPASPTTAYWAEIFPCLFTIAVELKEVPELSPQVLEMLNTWTSTPLSAAPAPSKTRAKLTVSRAALPGHTAELYCAAIFGVPILLFLFTGNIMVGMESYLVVIFGLIGFSRQQRSGDESSQGLSILFFSIALLCTIFFWLRGIGKIW